MQQKYRKKSEQQNFFSIFKILKIKRKNEILN